MTRDQESRPKIHKQLSPSPPPPQLAVSSGAEGPLCSPLYASPPPPDPWAFLEAKARTLWGERWRGGFDEGQDLLDDRDEREAWAARFVLTIPYPPGFNIDSEVRIAFADAWWLPDGALCWRVTGDGGEESNACTDEYPDPITDLLFDWDDRLVIFRINDAAD